MTRLYNEPSRFTEDMLDGFCDLNASSVRAVHGGVVRAVPGHNAKVAVVIGGGSGHYPAFCGLVGPGFADAAVVGNIFTSPSAQQAYTVAKAADHGGGVLFSFGNYAGDNLNFGVAQDRLRAEGVDCRTVVVTDDIASAPAEEKQLRRGIAGDFVVFKIASAAAEAGLSLDEVERVAHKANARTGTLGAAFGGCTLPGQDHPLFTVDEGKMGLGLGIHGEPGVAEGELPSASELADTLVDGILADALDTGSRRIGVVLNGLGSTKYEELFVMWSSVARRLRDAGFELVEPEAGELVTSLDMAGVSLTVVWLDDELQRWWSAPADTPAYRKGVRPAASPAVMRTSDAEPQDPAAYPEASTESRGCAHRIVQVLAAIRDKIEMNADELGRIDAVAGDGDHGRGMVKGTCAAYETARAAAAEGAGARSVLAAAGDAWAAQAGGTSGVLWGTGLRSFAEQLSDTHRPDTAELIVGAEAFSRTVQAIGKAAMGDKTMVDALSPFAHEYAASGSWSRAAATARAAAGETASLRPKIGRARPLAERSMGTPDAGAISFALIAETVAAALEEET